MKLRTTLPLTLLAATTLCSAAAVPIIDTPIREVTVYRDRAEVIREARVVVPPGESTVEFVEIPTGVETDSLRIAANGVPALLGAVEIVERVEKPEETPAYVSALGEVRRLERAIAERKAEQGVDDELNRFLGSLQAATADTESRKLGEGRSDPQSIAMFYTLLSERLGGLAARRIERDDTLRTLGEELELARARLNTERPASDIRTRVAIVELDVPQPGALTLRLAYVVPRANWTPSYRATLDAATGEIELVAEGVVRQTTGEDWSGVTLKLSTASPAIGVEPPMLRTRTLRPRLPSHPEGALYERVTVTSGAAVQLGRYQNTMRLAPGLQDAELESDVSAIEAQSTLVKSAYNVSFDVAGRSDVPADGRDHRVVLRRETLRGTLVHRTVPGLAPSAYLTAVTTAPADYPLLAGMVRVFAEGAYLGRFALTEAGPGVELTIPFGVDNRLEVERVAQPRSAGNQGVVGRQRELDYAYRTRLRNLQDRPVTLVLEERLPVAEDDRITVAQGKATSEGFVDSPRRPGVKLLTLELEPGEQREIAFEYSVRFPKDLTVDGLE